MFQQPTSSFDPRFQPVYPPQQYQQYMPQPTMPQQSMLQPTMPQQQIRPGTSYHHVTPEPHHPMHHAAHDYHALKAPTLQAVTPWVQYGLKEAHHTSIHHAMTEVAAISYLLGKGIDAHTAHMIVESWEKGETF